MSLSSTKRKQVVDYITELVGRQEAHIPSKVKEAFGLSKTTTQRYLRKLVDEGVVEKKGKNSYILKEETSVIVIQLNGTVIGEDSIFQQIAPKFAHFPERAKGNFSHICLEMLNNALEHSKASQIRIVLKTSPIELTCLILDDGIGIFKQIQNFFREQLNEEITLEDAKLQLVSGGFTCDKERHGGEGIYNSSLIADMFCILSGGLTFARDYEKIASYSLDFPAPKQGTAVVFSVHRDTQKTLKDAEHANPDEGFFRVTMPLKRMTLTGTALIARSQARRFTFNFAGKKEVVLDFEGITELCQPFAHEIFCVYRKARPEVKLIPKNTTEDMDKLIQSMLEK